MWRISEKNIIFNKKTNKQTDSRMIHSFQITIKVIWGKFLYFVHIKIHTAEKQNSAMSFFPQQRAALTRRTVHNNTRNTNYERTWGQL